MFGLNAKHLRANSLLLGSSNTSNELSSFPVRIFKTWSLIGILDPGVILLPFAQRAAAAGGCV
jgi:hypothetical protein